MTPQLVDAEYVADKLGVSKQTVLKNKKHPLFSKGVKPGGGESSRLMFFLDDVDNYLESLREAK